MPFLNFFKSYVEMEEQKKKEQVDFDKLVQKARSLGITVNERDLLFCNKLTILRMIADEIEYLEERLKKSVGRD